MKIKKRIIRAIILLLCLAGFIGYGYWLENNKKGDTGEILNTFSPQGRVDATKSEITQSGTMADSVVRVALTFDDGPHPYYTEQILDGLKERGVKATFFVTGEHAKLHPDVIQRMYDEGHLIGNHTYSHIMLKKENREAFKKELQDTNAVIKDITGAETTYARPPYGAWDKSLEKELDMFPVSWTVDPLDWCSKNVDCIEKRVLEAIRGDDIILFHDYYDTSVTAALKVVDVLLEKNYEFVTVDQLLFD